MRIIGSLMVLSAVAMVAAGCASQPAAYVSVAHAPGIDNVVYGQAAVPMPAAATAVAAPQRYPATRHATAATTRYATAAPASDVDPPSTGALPAPATRHVTATSTRTAAVPPTSYGTAPDADSIAPPTSYADIAEPRLASPAAYMPAVNEGPYTLDSGDRLRIVVFGQDGLTNSYAVGASGHIDMPLIGPVVARGATIDQLAGRIAGQLRNGFIREPHVAVEVEAYRPFFVLGEVTAPGQYPYVANMTVETAVAIAGGFGPRGVRDQVTISRNVGGRLFRFAAPVTYPVRPGDTIVIPERWF